MGTIMHGLFGADQATPASHVVFLLTRRDVVGGINVRYISIRVFVPLKYNMARI